MIHSGSFAADPVVSYRQLVALYSLIVVALEMKNAFKGFYCYY
jgi:hypothetical protein